MTGPLPRLGATTPGGAGTRTAGDTVGVVHLGIGAFHRAHQAVYTEDAMDADGDRRWGICGVTQRSDAVVEQLAPQDGRFGVLQLGADGASVRVISSVHEVVSAVRRPDVVAARIADARVGVVSLTVTEKGYRRDAAGHLDLTDAIVAADLAAAAHPADGVGAAPRSAIGRLVTGLQHRRGAHGAPLTVVSCDNLVGNGDVVAALVRDFCAALPAARGEPLAEWVAASVAFPNTMVDRIVPATTEADRERARRLLGLRDDGLVVAEPFSQWVLEDRFAAAVPAWHRAGATLTADVAPYEAVKLRLLNAANSLLAYAGALAGYDTIAEAVRDERLAAAAAALMEQDALPTLMAPDGMDLAGYRRSVLERFANPALRHRTAQVAMDGSVKLPQRLLGTIADRLRVGAEPRWAAFTLAAWMVYVARGTDRAGRPLPLDDPMADRLRAAAAGPPAGLVDRLLGLEQMFGPELRDSAVLRALLREHVVELLAP